MKKFSLLFLFGIFFYQTKAQNSKDQQQLKSVILQAYESVSQSARQWFADASSQVTVGNLDSAWVKNKLKERFSMNQLDVAGNVFAFMLEFQKMLNKEARADRKMAEQEKRLFLASKEEKLKMQNESIDQGMREARERADRAMDAAVWNLVLGIASGAMQYYCGPPANKANTAKETVAAYIRKLEAQLVLLKKVEIK